MKYKNVTLILLLGFIIGLQYTTQVSMAKESSLDLDESEAILGIRHSIVDDAGNIYVTGITESEDIFFTKFSKTGEQVWQKTILGSGIEEIERLRFDLNGNLIVLVQTQSDDMATLNAFQPNLGGESDIFLMKWDVDGNVLWSTYLGGEGEEIIQEWNQEDILLDNENNIIIFGITKSSNFPTTENAIQNEYRGAFDYLLSSSGVSHQAANGDGFITKFNSDGLVLWSTYYGSEGWDRIRVNLDNNDDLIAYGHIETDDLQVKNAVQSTLGGDIDSYITKISKDGELLWSTYYGGTVEDWVEYAVVDDQNNYYFVFATDSPNRDVKNAYQDYFAGGRRDLFIAKFDTNGNVMWSTYLGGSGDDEGDYTSFELGDFGTVDGELIFLDSEGNVLVYARTSSPDLELVNPLPEYGLPTINHSGGLLKHPFVAKFNSDGEIIHFSIVSGSETQVVSDIMIDRENNLFMIGLTDSLEYPIINAYQDQHNGGILDITITKLAANGTGLWSTYFGGSGRDDVVKSSLDQEGNLFLIGTTNSPDFPNTGSEEFSGVQDIFIAKFTKDGDLDWSILIGGSGIESVNRYGILTLPSGGFVLLGTTLSNDLLISGEVSPFDRNSFIATYDSDGNEVFSSYLFGEKQQPSQEYDFPLGFIVLALITISGGGFVLASRYFRRRHEMSVFLNEKMSNLLSPIFQHKPSLIYVFAGTKINLDKNLQKEIYTEIPGEIFDFRYFMHPIRLSMIKLLDENPTLTSIQMKDALGIDWKDITNHLNSLRKKGYITIEQMFIEDAIRSVIVANPNTLSQFKTLKEVLFEFLDASPNIDKYLELASDLKNREDSDDMYPTDQ